MGGRTGCLWGKTLENCPEKAVCFAREGAALFSASPAKAKHFLSSLNAQQMCQSFGLVELAEVCHTSQLALPVDGNFGSLLVLFFISAM